MLAFRLPHGFGEILGALHIHMGDHELVAVEYGINTFTSFAVNMFVDDAFFLGRKTTGSKLAHGKLL